jgi:hypothetical protein
MLLDPFMDTIDDATIPPVQLSAVVIEIFLLLHSSNRIFDS